MQNEIPAATGPHRNHPMNEKSPTVGASGVVYVGIDVAKETLAVFADGVFENEIKNTKKDIARLAHQLRKSFGKTSKIRFAMESTGPYSLPIHLELNRLGEEVCVLHSTSVRLYAKAIGILAKTDKIDARTIAVYAADRDCEPTPVPPETVLRLRETLRCRNLLTKIRTMVMTLRLLPHGNPTCRMVLAKVERFLENQIKILDRDMLELSKGDDRIHRVSGELEKLPGVGTITAISVAVLAPELGSLGRRRAAGLAGLAPIAKESGMYKGLRTIGGGRSDLRRVLYMSALSALKWDPVIKAFFDRLVHEKKKKPKVAITACMRKMFVHMDRVIADLDESSKKVSP